MSGISSTNTFGAVVPYKTLIYTTGNNSPAELFNNTGAIFTFAQIAVGIIEVRSDQLNTFEINKYSVTMCNNITSGVPVTMYRVIDFPPPATLIRFECRETTGGGYSNDGFLYFTFVCNFFP